MVQLRDASEKLEAAGQVAQLEGRIKRLYSIHQKLRRQRIDLDQVYDFVALRVLVKTIPDCYAALGVVHAMWTPLPGRFKDFIALPKPNQYQSLHTTVFGPSQTSMDSALGPPAPFRCFEFGVTCDDNSRQAGPRQDCQPREGWQSS